MSPVLDRTDQNQGIPGEDDERRGSVVAEPILHSSLVSRARAAMFDQQTAGHGPYPLSAAGK